MVDYKVLLPEIARIRELNYGKERTAFVMTFGCQQNEADSERVRGMLTDMGYTIAEDYSDADIIVVNTCAIRAHAEDKALSVLGNFKAVKAKNPELIVCVIGCMASEPHIVELLKTKFHYVSFTLEPNMLHRLPEAILAKLEDNRRSFILGMDTGEIFEGAPIQRMNAHRAWVSIMYGCNNFCSYCIVPYTRGRERSRDSAAVIEECKELIDDGVKEITLLGQNVNSYKSDVDFATLVERIASLEGDFLIRFMTSNPKDVSDRLIEVMGKYTSKVAPYFHLPLQSGSNRILKAMNRKYTKESFLDIVDKLRAAVPQIALSTDVIVGFPGEDESDFLDTLDVLRRARFDLVYSFRFSPREGTPAAKMYNMPPADVVDERMERLLKMQNEISYECNLSYVGRVERVLVDAISKKSELGTYSARTASNKLVHFAADNVKTGEFINVEIVKAGAFDLIGKIQSEEYKND